MNTFLSARRCATIAQLQRLLLILLFSCAVQALPPAEETFIVSGININAPVFTDACHRDLLIADANSDGLLNREEYVTFALLLSPPGLVDNVNSADELPVEYQNAFNSLTCLCDDPAFGGDASDTDCCGTQDFLKIPEGPGDFQPVTDLIFLYAICDATQEAARNTLESVAPTVGPTATPTTSPTFSPTAAPTSVPTVKPTQVPSASPSAAPTTSQAPSTTTHAPTVPPTEKPTPKPTDTERLEATASVSYQVAFLDANAVENLVNGEVDTFRFYADLNPAMDDLAFQVQATLNSQQRRRLQGTTIQVIPPTTFAEEVEIDCPTGDPDLALAHCVRITSEISLRVSGVNEEELDVTVKQYESELEGAIFDGELQQFLDALVDLNQIRIIVLTGIGGSSLAGVQGPASGEPETLSLAVTASIVVAAVVVFLIPLALLLFHRTQRHPDNKRKVYYEPYDVGDTPSDLGHESSIDTDLFTDAAMNGSLAGLRGTLGATQANYGRMTNKKILEAMEAGEDIVAEPEMDNERDSSSNAGSSGWSSSAGISSYNTGSMDDSMDAALAAGTTLANIGITSSLSKQLHHPHRLHHHDQRMGPSVSRDQLDSLIEAGDWAAVGATAALLAAASDSHSASSSYRGSLSTGSDPWDAARAAELDHLVDAGDWEGVVLAAAKFEAEATVGSRGSRTASSVDSETNTEGDGATGSSPSASESYTASDDPSRAKKQAEVRAEVEALVRRVVPEEIDNVDEMLNQFKGREEELVETLRTMQERAIAQKARAVKHKAAKVEARKNVKRGYVPRATKPPIANSSSSLTSGGGTLNSAVSSLADTSTVGSRQQTRTILERAIDAGDWEAVSQAAAMMSDGSIATTSTGEIERMAYSTTGSAQGRRSRTNSASSVRAAELEDMIDRGDWSAVVEAANRFSKADKRTMGQRSREEQEALAQAEFWTNIANQKKAQGANDAGASDAAEWAIQRSLTQMKEADRKRAQTAEEDEV